ncbi:unnamed protein product [Lupinus luteus]|uniref:Uncharacterized protein n=1 Tax=Lupinus luteus TaxID=3873 RepID=A0AAV1WND6_LUPLU
MVACDSWIIFRSFGMLYYNSKIVKISTYRKEWGILLSACAECNLLRMEKEIVVNKLHNTCASINTTITSTLHTLLTKLHKFQKMSGAKDSEATRNNKNLDKQDYVLQRRLKKIGGSSHEIYLKEFQEMAKISYKVKTSNTFDDNIGASILIVL